MTGLLVALGVLALATAVGLWRRRTDGRVRPVAPPVPAGSDPDGGTADGDASGAGDHRLDPELRATLGIGPAPATLLQFSSAFCAPCRATRRVLAEVAELVPGVRHVEVDAESHLDAVRALRIWRTPTTLILDADGRVVRRAGGVPSKPQVIAAIGEVAAVDRRGQERP